MPTTTEHHQVDIGFCLSPRWDQQSPHVQIRLDQHTLWDGYLRQTKSFRYSRSLIRGPHHLEIELHGKSDLDPIQSVTILDLTLGKIKSQRFLWQGVYRPRYPEPWAAQQKVLGMDLPPLLHNIDHLGWNGTWRLDLTVPIFTWIHQVEGLGWIYD